MLLLAAIRSATPTPVGSTPAPGGHPDLRDIAPPVDFFPFPLWQVVLAALVLALILGVLIWGAIRLWSRRMPPPLPTNKQLALAALAELRAQVRTLDAYRFSIAVSDVLRSFVERQYRVRARAQTSPEFLTAVAQSSEFTREDRCHLAAFLEQADLIKFAHIDAGAEANEELLNRAMTLVQGGRA